MHPKFDAMKTSKNMQKGFQNDAEMDVKSDTKLMENPKMQFFCFFKESHVIIEFFHGLRVPKFHGNSIKFYGKSESKNIDSK